MKTGRNAPCPCGSGKKYKKCCLSNKVTPPEDLHYRRLSRALDKLMPRLIDHGLTVFGELAEGVAVFEFFNWPEPGEEPNEEAIERAGMLFWPWFVFNWTYNSHEDEDVMLDGPEGATVAEVYLDYKKIDPQSLEGKLIFASNRRPYSFLEIVAVRPGQSVQTRDVLTGEEMWVQERLGSEILKKGDIIYGRAIQVDGVGMFLGLSAFALPPRMKPQLIELRRFLSRGKRKVTLVELDEWALEIRDVYLGLDRALHTPPELRNTDGDPMEFHTLIYDIDSSDLSVKKLAPLCLTESVDEIRAAAVKDENGKIHRATFDWHRKNNRKHKGMHDTVLGHIEIDGNQMRVTVNSVQRAKMIRKEIEKRLGTGARFRIDEISNFDQMMESFDKRSLPGDDRMQRPEVRHHIEQMLQMHWYNWMDEKISALGYQTPRQAIQTADGREAVEALLLDAENRATNEPIRAAIEHKIIAGVRRQLKLERPQRRKRSSPDPEQLVERIEQIKELISGFGNKRLHDTYTGFALSLCDVIAASEQLNLHRGRIDIWAAAIVYTIAQLNFLFSSETPNHLRPDELCHWFKVKKTTVSSKATKIRTTLDLFYDDERFCAPYITQNFRFYEDENGFILPAAAVDPGRDEVPEPLPLKPPAGVKKARSKKAVQPEKRSKKIDDRQLSLFED